MSADKTAKKAKKAATMTDAEKAALPELDRNLQEVREREQEAPVQDPTQSEAEKNYGKEALDAILATPEAAATIAGSLEPAVAEEIVRRLTKAATFSPRVRLSTAESPVKLVWRIASEMKAANPTVSRGEVVKACEAAGVATATAKTQYQHWKKAGEAKPFVPAA